MPKLDIDAPKKKPPFWKVVFYNILYGVVIVCALAFMIITLNPLIGTTATFGITFAVIGLFAYSTRVDIRR